MAYSDYRRDDRFRAGRSDRYDRDRGYSDERRSYPEWDRYGSTRNFGRSGSRYEGDYAAGDRRDWRTDDLGYADAFGFGTYPGDYYGRDERGYSRQGDYRDRSTRDGEDRGFMDRASDEVASWFGDEDASRRREMDQHRGKGPKGYIRTEERIREDTNDRLTDDPVLDASEIEVTVSGTEVSLNGYVTQRRDKRRAEDIAESVSGVSHVQNNLRVRNVGSTPATTLSS